MHRTKEPENATCHPDRPAYAHGLCRRCYDHARWTRRTPNKAVAEDVMAKIPRANRKPEQDTPRIRVERPRVAEYVARTAVKHQLDMERAVEEMKPNLGTAQVMELAQQLEANPNVQMAVEKEMQKRGLDESSKDHFVDILWRYAESGDPDDEKRQIAAWRLLGKAFMPDRVEVSKPEELKISGLGDGIRQMLGEGESSGAQGEAFSVPGAAFSISAEDE